MLYGVFSKNAVEPNSIEQNQQIQRWAKPSWLKYESSSNIGNSSMEIYLNYKSELQNYLRTLLRLIESYEEFQASLLVLP